MCFLQSPRPAPGLTVVSEAVLLMQPFEQGWSEMTLPFFPPLYPPAPFLSITWELNDGDLVEAQWVPVENWLVDKNPPIKGGYFLIYI